MSERDAIEALQREYARGARRWYWRHVGKKAWLCVPLISVLLYIALELARGQSRVWDLALPALALLLLGVVAMLGAFALMLALFSRSPSLSDWWRDRNRAPRHP